MEGMDAFNQQAFGILTSNRLAEALDHTREPTRTIEMCGQGDAGIRGGDALRLHATMHVPRRIVEARARAGTGAVR